MHSFNSTQLSVLRAISSTYFSKLTECETERVVRHSLQFAPSTTNHSDIRAFSSLSLDNFEGFFDKFIDKLTTTAYPDQLQVQKVVMSILSTGLGCYLLCGQRCVPFYELNLNEREAALIKWSISILPQIRGLFKVMHILTMAVLFGNYGRDPRIAKAIKLHDDVKPKFVNDFSPVFISPKNNGDRLSVINKYDVVIIGSGCGGGLVAAELSKAGQKVLVIEKGEYYDQAALSQQSEAEALSNLYERFGATLSEDFGIGIFAGSNFGGGSTVNWSASLKAPYEVREEWTRRFGLPVFTSKKYLEALDAVTSRIGVTASGVVHNAANQILFDGCVNLGLHCEVIPQNTGGLSHECGSCLYGCPSGVKQSSPRTWLKDAQENGTEIMKTCAASKVIHKNGKVVGVMCTYQSGTEFEQRLFIKAKRVVVSCGSLNSPALLLRSGLQNSNIGRNLRLHPVTVVSGTFDKSISQTKGAIMTAVSNAVKNLHGNGYGAIIEVIAYSPQLGATLLPWRSRTASKSVLATFDNQVLLIVLTRDYDSDGRVYLDGEGNPRISYSLSKNDQMSMVKGMEVAAKILIAAGAMQVQTSQTRVEPLNIDPNDPSPMSTNSFKDFISKINAEGVSLNATTLVSAHQMGSCRMSYSPSTGVVKPSGETWEVEGLFVADASLFPTASGVNPMVTTYSLAYLVAQEMKKALEKTKGL